MAAKAVGQSALVEIRSRRGIGAGKIVLPERNAPRALTLRLHLKGLENLQISDGTVTVTLSVLSHSGHRVLAGLRRSGQRRAADLKPGHPLRPVVRLVGADGKTIKKIPIPKGGHIEVTLPPALLSEFGRTLQVRWIDYYR